MQRYTNLIQDNAGNTLGGVTVTVYDQGTSNLSSIFSANGSGAKSNPFTNDTDGSVEFYAADGRYDVTYAKTGYTFTSSNYTDVVLADPKASGFGLTAPVISGTVTGTYTLGGTPSITAPILSGTITGTYTLGGTPTISSPVLSGTITGTYTLGGTPTITSPVLNSPQIVSPTFATSFNISDALFRVVGSVTSSKVIALEADGMSASTTLTLASVQTTSQQLNIPNITTTDTLVTTGLAQTVTGVKTLTNPTTAAGTSSIPSMTITNGTNLTSAAANSVENDAVALYFTTNTTDGRGHVPNRQHFRLTADGSAITTIANFFGSNSNISLVASASYYIDIVLWMSKSTSDTVTITLTNSAAPTSQNIVWQQSPITGLVAPPGTATWLFGNTHNDATAARAYTTGSLTTGQTHYIRIRIELVNGSGTSLKIQATSTTGSVTPLRGSFWTATRIPAGNTGSFAA